MHIETILFERKFRYRAVPAPDIRENTVE